MYTVGKIYQTTLKQTSFGIFLNFRGRQSEAVHHSVIRNVEKFGDFWSRATVPIRHTLLHQKDWGHGYKIRGPLKRTWSGQRSSWEKIMNSKTAVGVYLTLHMLKLFRLSKVMKNGISWLLNGKKGRRGSTMSVGKMAEEGEAQGGGRGKGREAKIEKKKQK